MGLCCFWGKLFEFLEDNKDYINNFRVCSHKDGLLVIALQYFMIGRK